MNKKFLVTGATGFIGSNLVKKLVQLNEEVHIICRKKSSLWRLDNIKDKINIHYINLQDTNKLEDLFKQYKFNVVFHLAMYGGYSFQNDINECIDINLIYTFKLAEIAKNNYVDIFINTSSSSEYGEKFYPMKEDMLLQPNNMYGSSKAAATTLLSTYSKENNFPLITLRLFSPYGYFDAPSRLIPTVIKNSLRNEDIYLGDKNSKRDFIFIDDVIDSYLKVSSVIKYGEIYNVGSGIEYCVEEIVEKIMCKTNSKSKLIWNNDLERRYEPIRWVSNIDKIKKDFNFSPQILIDDGLYKTIDWFEKNLFLYK